ncbi:MAG: peptide deformylase [Alphaproteobacteria bacterium]|nr:peptide deformylase [Alphaproteobacteria bacterium]
MSNTYEIITVPHPVLKQKAQAVSKVDDTIRKQMDGMLQTMYDAPGIGLAANQVDILNRVLVMDLKKRVERGYESEDGDDGDEKEEAIGPIFMANPEIIYESEEMSVMEEGCLSIPKQYAEIERPAIVRVKYLDYDNKEAELEATGLLSHCVQHEIDHLNGILFIDYLSTLKRNMIVKKVEKLKKQDLL